MTVLRKIIHVDMDAFYASVEQRDEPAYRGKAIAVGGSPGHRGVIAAASYEARRFGVRSAMASHRAMRLCPHLILLPARFEVYREVSRQIRQIFAEYTPLVEPLSLDEAYLDVTESAVGDISATGLAHELRRRIREVTGLTASAGVSYNKFLAKAASDFNKPDGLCVIPPNRAERFLEALPIGQFYGIGAKTAPRLKERGIHTGADLKALSHEALEALLGRSAAFYHQLVRGIDDRPVETDWVRKSVGAENTFARDLSDLDAIRDELIPLMAEVMAWMRRHQTYGRTVTVKVKYDDFQQITRRRTVPDALRESDALAALVDALLLSTEAGFRPVRLVGLSVSCLQSLAEILAGQAKQAASMGAFDLERRSDSSQSVGSDTGLFPHPIRAVKSSVHPHQSGPRQMPSEETDSQQLQLSLSV